MRFKALATAVVLLSALDAKAQETSKTRHDPSPTDGQDSQCRLYLGGESRWH